MLDKKLQPVSLNGARVDDKFWNKYTRLVTKEIIPYQWDALNDNVEDAEPSHCITNFRIAAGLEEGEFKGWVFQDSDLAKWLEAVAFSLSYEKNPKLEATADEMIELIGKAQKENGYLDTYFEIKTPGKEFCNLKEGHELYCAGHFIEAAVAYYKVTGKRAFLDIMMKCADHICEVFHTPKYLHGVPGHEEIELALMKLYDVTGEARYFEMAKEFVDRRGTEPEYLSNEHKDPDYEDVWHVGDYYERAYGQAHAPVREQTTAEGHSVRACYLYTGMADVAAAAHDEELLSACDTLYENITQKRMYITGGIGSSGTLERFTCDYDLPNDTNYSESCASIALAMFSRRMIQATGNAKYADTMERALMNTVLSGIAMDGKSFFYVNPLEVWPDNCMPRTDRQHIKPIRQKWFGCACCPPNIARTLASLPEYAILEGDDGIYVNMFVAGTYEVNVGNTKATLEIKTDFPWKGNVSVNLKAADGTNLAGCLRLRVPGYAKEPKISYNGSAALDEFTVENGYAVINLDLPQANVELTFDMPAEIVYANPLVRANNGKCAIVKGPVVYCLEQADNGEDLSALFIDSSAKLIEEFDESLYGGVVKVSVSGRRLDVDGFGKSLYGVMPPKFTDAELTFVPYANWGNRAAGEMSVWTKYI